MCRKQNFSGRTEWIRRESESPCRDKFLQTCTGPDTQLDTSRVEVSAHLQPQQIRASTNIVLTGQQLPSHQAQATMVWWEWQSAGAPHKQTHSALLLLGKETHLSIDLTCQLSAFHSSIGSMTAGWLDQSKIWSTRKERKCEGRKWF